MKKGPDVFRASGPISAGVVPIEISASSFVANLLVCLLPSLLIGEVLSLVFSASPAPESVETFATVHWLRAVFLLCVFAPLVENCFLLYPAHLISLVVRSHWLVCLIAAAPVVLAHAYPDRWEKSIAVAWPFVWFVHCFFVLKAKGVPLPSRFWFIFALHAGVNAVLLGLVRVADLIL
ncbi:hypothetical protein [Rhizobacter sp. SG703]|uniref:hypothetical protein n=1 Tax=Rhizobacter sp. SG703 TaxID=2587140 RepID=UPI001444E112|nr:hypothetical protein [Rhizobacter sp. SG703]NKI97092.1 hypothetical protein [Rhizobacter sp. SG703]